MQRLKRLAAAIAGLLGDSKKVQEEPYFQITGTYIGGRLVKGMTLLPGEHVIKAGDAQCRRSFWTVGWGALFLTNMRVIYCPEKYLLGGPFWWSPFAIQLPSINSVRASTGALSNLYIPSRLDVKTGHKHHSFGFGLRGGQMRKDWLIAIEKAVREYEAFDKE
jgi:hypothetical protein